jgi:hypothetical protein
MGEIRIGMLSPFLDGYTGFWKLGMAVQSEAVQHERQRMSEMEWLSLRISEMINHPIAQLQRWVLIQRLDSDGNQKWEQALSNRPGKSSSVAGSIVLRDCATMKLSPQCRSGTAGHHHPSQTRSKHFLVLSTIETLEITFKRCWIT